MAKRHGHSVQGLLLLDKPAGISSNAALQTVKRLFQANKAGHTGTLDPLATGMLPICFGEATKFSQFLLDTDKRYRAEALLGVSTDSGDVDGNRLASKDSSHISEAMVEQAMQPLRGAIQQLPPMYSALKYKGKPLYHYARQGIEVPRQARPINIYDFSLLSYQEGQQPQASFSIHCSKGTYIRALIQDLGDALQVGAHITQLHRQQVGNLSTQLVSLDTLQAASNNPADLEQFLLPVDSLVSHLNAIQLNQNQQRAFSQGQRLALSDQQQQALADQPASKEQHLRVYVKSATGQQFLGIGTIDTNNNLSPKRLIAS